MTIFPQLPNGTLCQFPLERTLRYRTIANLAEDGSRFVLQDPNASAIQWKLSYTGLTDGELDIIRSFFESCSGRLRSFTFVDPSANLLTWSEDFSQTAWQTNTFLQLQAGVLDPLGTRRATTVTNAGATDVALVQTIAVPDVYLCSFSLFARSDHANSIILCRGTGSKPVSISHSWRQVFLSTSLPDGGTSSSFGVTIPAGGSVDIFGLQVEAQLAPSTYVQSLDQSGVYPLTRFDSDSLSISASAPNSNSCQISLYSRLTL